MVLKLAQLGPRTMSELVDVQVLMGVINIINSQETAEKGNNKPIAHPYLSLLRVWMRPP